MTSYRGKVDTSNCYFCPARENIEVHHILPQRFRENNDRENLVAVCYECHKKLEQLYDKSFYNAIGVEDCQGVRKFHIMCPHCEERTVKRKVKLSPNAAALYFCNECAKEKAKRQVEEPLELVSIQTPSMDELIEKKLEEITIAVEGEQ